MSAPRVLVHVQHLLGTGHLRRAALLARALAADGMAVDIASGGRPVPGLETGPARLRQLPPLAAADAGFQILVDAEGREIDETWRAARARHVLAIFQDTDPDILITETFPFGRRTLRFELLPLLEAARARRPRTLCVASLRDILQSRRKPGRHAEAVDLARRHYDRVLVHGDPAFASLEASVPEAAGIADLVRYTGYLADAENLAVAADAADGGADGEVVVSAGGGAVGQRLLETALAARPLTRFAERPWRLLAGDRAGGTVDLLRAKAPAGVTVEASRTDFRRLLAAASVSISQAGYNTVMDIARTRARAVLVPFGGDGETEQPMRARLLAARGWAETVGEDALTPAALAAAVDRAADRPRPAIALDLDGMAASARLVRELAGRHG